MNIYMLERIENVKPGECDFAVIKALNEEKAIPIAKEKLSLNNAPEAWENAIITDMGCIGKGVPKTPEVILSSNSGEEYE